MQHLLSLDIYITSAIHTQNARHDVGKVRSYNGQMSVVTLIP